MEDNHTIRLEAYKEVKHIVEKSTSKLNEAEMKTILWAAEGTLLAASTDDPDFVESQQAFTTLMDDLESHRWAEMVGTEENPGTGMKLRRAFAACAPAADVVAS